MLTSYGLADGRLTVAPDGQTDDDAPVPIWHDLLSPSRDELRILSDRLGVDLPSQAEMQEIELSARLYVEDGAVFMTASVLSALDTAEPVMAPLTFVLTDSAVITLRYHEPRAITTFTRRAARSAMDCNTPQQLLVSLLDAIVERIADVLERESATLDRIAREIFRKDATNPRGGVDLAAMLGEIGRRGELNSKLQESLVTLDRIAAFLSQLSLGRTLPKSARARLKSLSRDVRSLTDHAGFQAGKVTFLLDATLGLVNIQQNGIIKIFSVAAVVFLPPTMIASVYGMNFEVMPELRWPLGYPFALSLMVLSAVLPYFYFKRRGWL
ncbi:magnesium transporter CorA family protein [Meridianimarinicoccus sp. RP-17]|uniref:magnesium transporter CorA family protein n=1 Tax=Meridianimarinicoccus zhengii TaxID=2056810 RepID=UPI000DAB7633|nr:magnesium transporter CorA family protein [Phycocomes zhengii]